MSQTTAYCVALVLGGGLIGHFTSRGPLWFSFAPLVIWYIVVTFIYYR